MKEAFGKQQNYKLYRTLNDLIHPSISRKNITNYKIILDESLVPIYVFYPDKYTKLEHIIIYIHGEHIEEENSYNTLCKDLALNTKTLVLAIDYKEQKEEECFSMIKYIYDNIKEISADQISIMGDARGADIVLKLTATANFKINKQIIVYPNLNKEIDSLIYNKKIKTLFLTADLDSRKDRMKDYFDNKIKGNKHSSYINIKSVTQGFLSTPLNSKREECFELIYQFIQQ